MAEPSNAGSFSIGRVLLVVVPLALVGWAAKMYSGNLETDAKANLERTMASRLLGDQGAAAKLNKKYADADGDLVADSPPDATKSIEPKEINFSYVASSDAEDEEAAWKEFLATLEKRLGRKVNHVAYADRGEQMRALEKGDLTVTAFATGEVQGAVNEAGFVPVACFANKDGKYHYTMKIIVPADSEINKPEDIRGKRMIFVRPQSNSGCTAALVTLMKEHDLQPERDYSWGFSFGHENSIEGVAKKRFPAAAVASDILDRMVASGAVKADEIKVIYESKPYPPGVVGFAYNLTPELREGIRETLLGFDWKGTGLEKTYGSSGNVKFAPVNYKDDWAPVREISKAGSELFAKLDAPAA
jgi:phosphonate transport system substrate-binding protein